MSRYIPPKGFFDPDDLAVMENALQGTWAAIETSNLLSLAKDDALKRAVCVKLFSVIRSKPIEPGVLLAALLETLREDPKSQPSSP